MFHAVFRPPAGYGSTSLVPVNFQDDSDQWTVYLRTPSLQAMFYSNPKSLAWGPQFQYQVEPGQATAVVVCMTRIDKYHNAETGSSKLTT